MAEIVSCLDASDMLFSHGGPSHLMGPRPAGAWTPCGSVDALRARGRPAGAWTPCGRVDALRARGRPAGAWTPPFQGIEPTPLTVDGKNWVEKSRNRPYLGHCGELAGDLW